MCTITKLLFEKGQENVTIDHFLFVNKTVDCGVH